MLQEGAAILVSRLLPEITEDDWYNALLTAQDYLLSLGITGWQDAIVGRYEGEADPLTAYLRAAEAGTLLASVTGALWWDRHRGLEQLGELLEQRSTGQAGTFRATSVKMMLDGVAENHTAAMLEPYLDGDGCSTGKAGLDFIDPHELPTFVAALDREGFQVHFHALGDRAVRNALDAVEAARRANGAGGGRHHLAHLQVIHPDDVPRFARVSATANIQPLWATHEPQMDELTIPFLGERRAGWQYPFRSLEAAGRGHVRGQRLAGQQPQPTVGGARRRQPAPACPAGGQGGDPFLPQQAIGLTSILTAYTYTSSHAATWRQRSDITQLIASPARDQRHPFSVAITGAIIRATSSMRETGMPAYVVVCGARRTSGVTASPHFPLCGEVIFRQGQPVRSARG